jgi:hypothetical protein
MQLSIIHKSEGQKLLSGGQKLLSGQGWNVVGKNRSSLERHEAIQADDDELLGTKVVGRCMY